MIMKKFYLLLALFCYICVYAQDIDTIQQHFSQPNRVYFIEKKYDLRGDTLFLPTNCTLSFQGGSIENGTVMGPYGKNTYIDGIYKYANAKYYGDFYTKDNVQLTYRLDRIERPFKLYHPFALSYPVKDGIDAYHLSGAQGTFLIYHVSNRYGDISTDSVFIWGDDKKYVKDNDRDILEKLINPLINNRVNVVGLMFHCEGGWDDSSYSKKLAGNYQAYILHKVDLLKKYFPMMKIIYISNEQPWFTGNVQGLKDKSKYTKGWSDCLYSLSKKIHKRNLLSGFKFAGPDVESIISMDKKLIKSIDYWGINLYPISGDENKTNLYSKYFIDYYAKGIDCFMNLLKKHHKSIEINITETGCFPYRESIPKPWQYASFNLHDNDAVTITTNMMRKILDSVPYKTESVTFWFLGALIDKYGVTEETIDRLYQGYLK